MIEVFGIILGLGLNLAALYFLWTRRRAFSSLSVPPAHAAVFSDQ